MIVFKQGAFNFMKSQTTPQSNNYYTHKNTKTPPIWVLVLMTSTGPFGDTEYVPSMNNIAAHFGVSYGAVILTMTSYLIGYAISQLFYGPLSDRFGRRPIALTGASAFIIGSIVCLFSPTLPILIAGRFFQALGACAGTIISFAAVRDSFPVSRQAKTYARINAAFTIAPALGPVIGGFVDDLFGWRANFTVLLIMSIILLSVVYKFFPETNYNLNRKAIRPSYVIQTYLSLFKHHYYPFYLIIIGLCISVVYNCLTEAPSLIIGIMQLSSKSFAAVAACVMLGFVCGSMTCAYLSDKLRSQTIILCGLSVMLCSAISMAICIWLGLLYLSILLIPIGFLFSGIALVLPIASARALAPFGHIAGSASAMLGFFQMSFASTSTWALSYFHTGSAYAMPVSFSILSSLALVVLFTTIIMRPKPSETS